MDQEIKKIHTLSELTEEKERLRREISISKEEFFRSFSVTKSHAKSLVLNGLALPAGILGVTIAGVKAFQALGNGQEKKQTEEEYLHYSSNPPSIMESVKANLASNSKWYVRLIPIAVQLVSKFLANRRNYQHEDVEAFPAESVARQRG